MDLINNHKRSNKKPAWYHGSLAPAITELEISHNTYKTNEPINRKEGNTKQAELEREYKVSIGKAINILKRMP